MSPRKIIPKGLEERRWRLAPCQQQSQPWSETVRSRAGEEAEGTEKMCTFYRGLPGSVAGRAQGPRENQEVEMGPGETLVEDKRDAGSADHG